MQPFRRFFHNKISPEWVKPDSPILWNSREGQLGLRYNRIRHNHLPRENFRKFQPTKLPANCLSESRFTMANGGSKTSQKIRATDDVIGFGPRPAAPNTVAEFFKLLKLSGLLKPDELAFIYQQFLEKPGLSDRDAQSLAKYLTRAKLLSRWQASCILQGEIYRLQVGRFQLIKHLREAAIRSLYLAYDPVWNRHVAVKIFELEEMPDREAFRRFPDNTKTFGFLEHENILRLYQLDVDNDHCFLVMEYLDGQSLQQFVEREGPLSPPLAVRFIRQIASGLAFAHQARLVHGHLQPGNVLVEKSTEMAKVLDLGLVMEFLPDATSVTINGSGELMATADYMAPEQIQAPDQADARTDLYALGGTLFFLLTGQPPFPASNFAAKVAHHLMDPPPQLREVRPGLPSDLNVICQKLMAKHQADRFQTAAEVREALTKVRMG